jgi:phosphate starvation-inducible PhoH-like protein
MVKITHPFVKKSVFTGVLDRNLKKLENRLGVTLAMRGDCLIVDGEPAKVEAARLYFERIHDLEEKGHDLREDDFHIVLDLLEEGKPKPLEMYAPAEPLTLSRKSVTPKSLNQRDYIQAIRERDLVFGIGPAGTGKTYLAMAMALSYYQNKQVGRIILTRPAVEAGERLGFLPGDMLQKVNPYLRPLYDALFDLIQYEQATRLIEKNVIEIAPLAYMRGRTLNNAFIIMDEAQNTTREQMKMLLTRTGFDSKVVITADVTQIDLPQPAKSGVIHAVRVLAAVKEIGFCYFNEKDVVRHPLVQKIIKAYQKAESRSQE